MVAFKIVSDNSIIVTIVKEFKKKDLNGISIIVDALFENNYNSNLFFNLDIRLDKQCESLLKNYCDRTPYNYQINRINRIN
jgi:hypothetical protein